MTLAALREQGMTFSEAWSIAVQRIRVRKDDPTATELHDWKVAIKWAEPYFAAAYENSDVPAMMLEPV